MSTSLEEHLPSAELLLQLPIEELSLATLRLIRARSTRTGGASGVSQLDRIANADDPAFQQYAGELRRDVARALAEAWSWLMGHGFLAQDPRLSPGIPGQFVTRRGDVWLASERPHEWLASSLLDERALDPQLAGEVLPPFMRGQLDLAVNVAYRRVEVRLRERSGIGTSILSATAAAAAAFKTQEPRGPLAENRRRDAAQIEGERNILMGAMGRFRNPATHGDIGLDDVGETVELIRFANLLLRVIDRAATEAGRAP